MTKGEEIVKTWESRQAHGRYPSYVESMADLAALIDSEVNLHTDYIIDMTDKASREEEFQMAMHGYVGQD